MTWVKLDDHFPEDDVVSELTHASFRLHVIALCYCARNLTDGILDKRAIRVCTSILTTGRANRNVDELVRVGLWKRHESGDFEIKNYLEFNPSKEQVDAQRERNANRQSRHRMRNREDSNGVTNGVTNGARNGVSNAAPTRPVPKDLKTVGDRPVEKLSEEQLADLAKLGDRDLLIDRILAGCKDAHDGTRKVLVNAASGLDAGLLTDVALSVERRPMFAGAVVTLLRKHVRQSAAKDARRAAAVQAFLENLGPEYAHDPSSFAEEYVRVAGPTEASVIEGFRLSCLPKAEEAAA